MKLKRALDALAIALLLSSVVITILSFFVHVMAIVYKAILIYLIAGMGVIIIYRAIEEMGGWRWFLRTCRIALSSMRHYDRYELAKIFINILLFACSIACFFMMLLYDDLLFGILSFLFFLGMPLLYKIPAPYYVPEVGRRLQTVASLVRLAIGLVLGGFAVSQLWFYAFYVIRMNWWAPIPLMILGLWASYKLVCFITAREASSGISELLKRSEEVELLEGLEIRVLEHLPSPIAVEWRNGKFLFLPAYLLSNDVKSEWRQAILNHELTHLELDGWARWQELRRREELKAMLLGCTLLIVIFPALGLVMSLARSIDIWRLTGEPVYRLWPRLILDFINIMLDLFLMLLAGLGLAAWMFILISIGLTIGAHAVRFREARADFLAVLETGDPEAYRAALHMAYEKAGERLPDDRAAVGGPLMALCFAPPGGRASEGRSGQLSLRSITRARLKDVLWFPKNVHSSLPEREFVIDMAGDLLGDGLRIEFRRPLEEADYLRFAASPDDLPRLKCLLSSMEELCRRDGRLRLRDLEEAMSREGFEFSYAELFGALVFLEDRGIASVGPRAPGT